MMLESATKKKKNNEFNQIVASEWAGESKRRTHE